MRAIQIHGYGDVSQLRYEDVPTPSPGPGQVLIKVAATSVNPIDWKIRRGDLKGMLSVQFPAIPGGDVAGEVVSIGANVLNLEPGQKVMGLVSRTYAEFVCVPADMLALVPDGLDLELAGALPLVTLSGAQLIERVGPTRGETVLVTGALGSVGRSAVYAAIERGARVIAAVRERQKVQAAALGAERVIAIDVDSELLGLPEIDSIADTVGGHITAKLIPKLKQGGVLGSVVSTPEKDSERHIRAFAFFARPDPDTLVHFAEAVRDGKLDIPVAKKFKLSEAAEAQKLAEEGNAGGKVVLIP